MKRVVIAAVHKPRTLQRIVSAIVGCGFAIEHLEYHREDDRHALVTVGLKDHSGQRGVSHLCQVITRNVDVLWARAVIRDTHSSADDGAEQLDQQTELPRGRVRVPKA